MSWAVCRHHVLVPRAMWKGKGLVFVCDSDLSLLDVVGTDMRRPTATSCKCYRKCEVQPINLQFSTRRCSSSWRCFPLLGACSSSGRSTLTLTSGMSACIAQMVQVVLFASPLSPGNIFTLFDVSPWCFLPDMVPSSCSFQCCFYVDITFTITTFAFG